MEVDMDMVVQMDLGIEKRVFWTNSPITGRLCQGIAESGNGKHVSRASCSIRSCVELLSGWRWRWAWKMEEEMDMDMDM